MEHFEDEKDKFSSDGKANKDAAGSGKKDTEGGAAGRNAGEQPSGPAGAGEGAFAWGKGLLPDILKKMLVAGIGAVAVGEEGIRRLATDMSLPKDAMVFLISQVQSTKNELFRIVARELRDFLEHTDLGGELQKALTSLTFEVTMQIRLKPSKESNGVIPSVAGKVRVRNGDDAK